MFSEDEIMNQIKTKALCIFRYKEKVLLSKGYDPNKNENYFAYNIPDWNTHGKKCRFSI